MPAAAAYGIVGLILGLFAGLVLGMGTTLLIQRWRWTTIRTQQALPVGVPARQWTEVTYHHHDGTQVTYPLPTRGLRPQMVEPRASDGRQYYADLPEDRANLTTLHYYPVRHGPEPPVPGA